MTTKYLATDIAWDEAPSGVPVLHAYGDPLTHAEPWTIGLGSTGPDIGPDTVWTADTAFKRRDAEIASLVQHFSALPWWNAIDDNRQDVFINMGYQMGFEGVMKFTSTLAAVARGAWETAAADMLNSLWARQTPGRAKRLAEQARTGTRIIRSYDARIDAATQPVGVPAQQPKEGIIMSLVSSAFHFVFDHAFAAAAREAATANPVAAAAGIATVQITPMPSEGSPNSTAGMASPLIRQLEDDLNAVVASFVKAGVDQLPVVGGILSATGLDQRAADAAKAMLVMGEQHALTYLSALFSGHHIAVNAVTVPSSNGASVAVQANAPLAQQQ